MTLLRAVLPGQFREFTFIWEAISPSSPRYRENCRILRRGRACRGRQGEDKSGWYCEPSFRIRNDVFYFARTKRTDYGPAKSRLRRWKKSKPAKTALQQIRDDAGERKVDSVADDDAATFPGRNWLSVRKSTNARKPPPPRLRQNGSA